MALAKTKKKKLRKKLFSPQGLKRKTIKKESFSEAQLENFKALVNFDKKFFTNENSLVIGFDEVGRGCVAGPVCTAAYSCSSFYSNTEELIQEVVRSRQLISSEFLNLDTRSSYYAETFINESNLDDDMEEVQEISFLMNLDDSKKVLKNKRELLCKALLNVPCFNSESHILHSINFESAKLIDKSGIVTCIWRSMVKNLATIIEEYMTLYNQAPSRIVALVDGPKTIPNLTKLLAEECKSKAMFDLQFIEIDPNPKQTKLLETNATEILQIPIVKGDSKSALIAAASNLAKQERDVYMEKISSQKKYANYIWAKNVGYGTKKHIEAILEHGLSDQHRKSFLEAYVGN